MNIVSETTLIKLVGREKTNRLNYYAVSLENKKRNTSLPFSNSLS